MASTSTWNQVLNTLQIRNNYERKPWGLGWRSNTIFILSTIAVALFTDLFLYGLIVPILPFMLEDRVGLPKEQIQSHVDGLLAAYAGTSVLASPIAGVLADRLKSRQAPFLLGLTALLGATTLLFTGRSVAVLVIARVLQGISAAFVWTIGLALCLETVGPQNLGKTMGSLFSIITIGPLCAPLVGGVLYEKVGLTGVFAMASAVLAIDLIMRLLVIEKKIARRYGVEKARGTDDSGETTGHHEENQADQHTPQDDGEEQPLLGRQDKDQVTFKLSKDQPRLAKLIPILPCLANPRILTALLVAFIQATLLGSFDATIPTVSRELFGFDSLKAGILFIPLGIFDLILGPVFGWLIDRYGTKVVAVGGYTLLVPVLVLLRLPQAGGQDQVFLYGGILAICGVGLSAVGAPSIVEAGAVVQKYHEVNPDFFGEIGPYAQLYGLNSMVFSAGLTVGPELAGELKSAIGYGNMNAVLAGICAATAFLSLVFIGGTPRIFQKSRSGG